MRTRGPCRGGSSRSFTCASLTFLSMVLLSTALPSWAGAPQATAFATDASDPEALIARGLLLREAGQDQQALALFQEAVARSKTPRAVAQVGLCEYALGLWVDAEAHVQQALASKTDPWIRKNERTLKVALDELQEKVGGLDVWGEPRGARLALDGHAVGTLPLAQPMRVPAGRHTLLVEADGFLSDTRSLDVRPRIVTREHVALAPVPLTKAPPPVASSAEPTLLRAASAPEATPGEAAETSTPFYKTWWFWTAMGVAALAGAGTAIALGRKNDCDAAGASSCVAW